MSRADNDFRFAPFLRLRIFYVTNEECSLILCCVLKKHRAFQHGALVFYRLLNQGLRILLDFNPTALASLLWGSIDLSLASVSTYATLSRQVGTCKANRCVIPVSANRVLCSVTVKVDHWLTQLVPLPGALVRVLLPGLNWLSTGRCNDCGFAIPLSAGC